MSSYALSTELGLLEQESDRRFKRFLGILGIPALIAGIAIPLWQVSYLAKGGGEAQVPRYARLLAPSANPAPVEESPKPQKTVTKPKQQLTQEQKVERARVKASKAISQLQNMLADIPDTTVATNTPLKQQVVTSQSGNNPSFAKQATATSGGIGEVAPVQRKESGTGLGERKTTSVQSPVGAGRDQSRSGSGGETVLKGRSFEEIQLVFERSHGSFFAMFQRALRDQPDMQGKIVLRLVIAPSGRVTKCSIVSSQLHNPDFEKKVVARVLLLDFGKKDVPDFTIDYPINFLPP